MLCFVVQLHSRGELAAAAAAAAATATAAAAATLMLMAALEAQAHPVTAMVNKNAAAVVTADSSTWREVSCRMQLSGWEEVLLPSLLLTLLLCHCCCCRRRHSCTCSCHWCC
jgi:hypothetical protein